MSDDPAATRTTPVAENRGTWALQVGILFGIPIRIHVTFLLLLFWIGFAASQRGDSPARAVIALVLLFACVALHELGHAVAAKTYGIQTGEIVLYPIGGIARLDKIPEGRPELLIALAGPAVNVVIAAALAVVLIAMGLPLLPADVELVSGHLGQQLFVANVILVLFNLIPAFPMDGGRVLRAALAMRMPAERATGIAATVGQGIAMIGGLVGVLSGNFVLLFIALFVFLGAGQEAVFFQQRAAMLGRTAREAMITRFETLAPNDSLSRASELLLATHQHDFPVVDAWGRVSGVLSRTALLRGLATAGGSGAVLEAMHRDVPTIAPTAQLEDVLRTIRANPALPVLVLDDQALLGMITLENLTEFIQIAQARHSEA